MAEKNTKISENVKEKGSTMVELVVALGIFVTIMTISVAILLDSLRTMRFVADQARAVDNISLAMERMAREIRTGSNIAGEGLISQISFINHEGLAVTYSFCDNGTKICRNNSPITASNLRITGSFFVNLFRVNGIPTKTPRITISAMAEDVRGNPLASIQTTVSARLIFYQTPI